jgi:hypothetical protein
MCHPGKIILSSYSKDGKGKGPGLYIVKGLIEEMAAGSR